MGFFAGSSPGVIYLSADPTVIATNKTLYPEGFQSPNAIYEYLQTSLAANGGGQRVGTDYSNNNWTVGAYVQDDFKVSSTLTLNLGLRWDMFSVFNSEANRSMEATYLVLKAIGSPYGVLPKNFPDTHDYQPRVGLAWDVGGNGKNVQRASFGIFYDPQLKNTTYLLDQQSPPQTGIFYTSSVVSPGFGLNPNPVLTPLPAIPPISTTFPAGLNSAGAWYDPNHSKDAESQQYHVGWSHLFGGNSVLAVDHTEIFGYHLWRTLDINPIITECGRWLQRCRAPLVAHRSWGRCTSRPLSIIRFMTKQWSIMSDDLGRTASRSIMCSPGRMRWRATATPRLAA